MATQRLSPQDRVYQVPLTADEIYEVCNGLNSEAGRFDGLIAKARQPGSRQSEQTIYVWRNHADQLRGLTRKILDARKLPNGGRR